MKIFSRKSKSGMQVKNDNRFYKVGRVNYNSWATKILKACDIVIFDDGIVHITKRHGRSLNKLGFDALSFVKYVISNYNEVREGSNNSFLLVVDRQNVANVIAIELIKVVDNKKEVYRVNTATLYNKKSLNQKKLLCVNDH